MRIAFVGNVANFSYRIAKAIHQHTNLDVHLYIPSGAGPAARPESDDPELKDHYPAWIHRWDFYQRGRIYPVLFPMIAPIVRELKTYDLIIASDDAPAYTPFVGKPYCFLATGADLTVSPFVWRFFFWKKPSLVKFFGTLARAYWVRRGIRRAAEIWAQPFSPFMNALQELKVSPTKISPVYFPFAIDTEHFKPDPVLLERADENVRHIQRNYDFVLFHPSRLLIESDPRLRVVGQWKQNDVLIKGFAEFLRQSGAERAVLVMPDVTLSRDVPLARELIRSLGIEEQVFWAKAPRPEAFNREELLPYYMAADVVADDFSIGWFGGVVLEGAALARPVISYVDETAMKQLYPWHPILSTNTPEGVAEHLLMLYRNPERKREIGLKGRQWIEEFHALPVVTQIYVQQITALANRYRDRAVKPQPSGPGI